MLVCTAAGGFVLGRATASSVGISTVAETASGAGDDSALVTAGGTASPASAAASSLVEQGLAAHTAGRLDEAKDLYSQALAKDPKNKFAYFNLGQIARDTK